MKQIFYDCDFNKVIERVKETYIGCRDVIIVDYEEKESGEYEFEFYLIY